MYQMTISYREILNNVFVPITTSTCTTSLIDIDIATTSNLTDELNSAKKKKLSCNLDVE
jgi:hypothetical protein